MNEAKHEMVNFENTMDKGKKIQRKKKDRNENQVCIRLTIGDSKWDKISNSEGY